MLDYSNANIFYSLWEPPPENGYLSQLCVVCTGGLGDGFSCLQTKCNGIRVHK